MRVLVCGGRDYNGDEPWNHVMRVLGDLHAENSIEAVIQGGAPGADLLGRCWADMHEVKCVTVPADWETLGRAAGPIRNERMITDFHPDLVVAFPGGKGTADMVRRAKAHGLRVLNEAPRA